MNRYVNDNLILSPDESNRLIESLLNPNKEVLNKRDLFLKTFDELNIIEKENGRILIEVPDFVLKESVSSIAIKGNSMEEYCFVNHTYIEVRYGSGEIKKIDADNIKYSSKSNGNDVFYDVKLNIAAVA